MYTYLNACTCLPIALMRNQVQEKKSMRGASGFAEVELKLSINAARCEGLSYLLSLINIYIRYKNAILSHIDCLFRKTKDKAHNGAFFRDI